MLLIIKVLKGQELTLNVEASDTILEIKQRIEDNLKVPLANQKLLLLGRTLNDENTVGSYSSIKDGTKLTLIAMRPESLRDQILRSFRKYYNEQQSYKLTIEFMEDFEKRMKQCSLDDIERFAENVHNTN